MNRLSRFAVLFVDDEEMILSSLQRSFIKEDFDLHSARSGQEALSILGSCSIDLALTDLKMPVMDGMALLQEIKANFPEVSVIMLTGHGSIADAVQAIQFGASDFLLKPFAPEDLKAKVGHFQQIWKLNQENKKLRKELDEHFKFDSMLGNSPVMLKLKRMIAQVAPGDASILIQGETGTGKELIARAIHNHSERKEQPFVPVDCAALNETLMESELFGHVKGAFTGAHVASQGLFKAANGGTLFFDEIGELPLAMQVKLLRSIQEKEVRSVGSTKAVPVDVRIVAATNRNLAEEIGKGNFREDLFYRINMIEIVSPPLRERGDDLILLVKYFIKQFANQFSPVTTLAPETIEYLRNYRWPGNIRELENVIRRAISLGRSEAVLPGDLPDTIYRQKTEYVVPMQTISAADPSMDAYEKAAIVNALKLSDSNRKEAAILLGIGEATLYRKLKKYFE
ncbi:MAG: DNA-binding response regulator [Desulfotalea sp.]|nr:MAG: DNA-binding response regulator [Desulfotalea sp.]